MARGSSAAEAGSRHVDRHDSSICVCVTICMCPGKIGKLTTAALIRWPRYAPSPGPELSSFISKVVLTLVDFWLVKEPLMLHEGRRGGWLMLI
jgi:hypothetical protein